MKVTTSSPRSIRVVFCWADVSGYMAACWRALAKRPGVEVHVLHPELLLRANPFREDGDLMRDISNERFETGAPDIDRVLRDAVVAKRPDVVVICGWLYWPYTKVAQARELQHAKIIVGMDSPWRGTLTQWLARFRLATTIRRLDGMVTSGERSREYARRLGVPESRIRTGYYGFDYDTYSRVADGRSAKKGEWPRQFLYVGRYVPAKDLATLAAAYSGVPPIGDVALGTDVLRMGRGGTFSEDVPGLENAGFKPPSQLAEIFSRHGAFVLPSKFEPWGVVVAEASASGLPVICTTACGAGDDLVRDYYSGITVAPGDIGGMARAMRWVHDHEDDLRLMGQRGRAMSEAFSAESWAARWHEHFLDVLNR